MPSKSERTERPVYKTRIVRSSAGLEDAAVNHFHDLDEAKKWLEGYFEIRWGLTPGDWEESEICGNERWHIQPEDADDCRGVVREIEMREDADELLETLEEIMADMEATA